MTKIRKQLTLFVNQIDAMNIEVVRAKYNPQQKKLIDCHVTLCREDELFDVDKIMDNLIHLDANPLTIVLGEATRFHHAEGVLLPARGYPEAFHQLRDRVLKGSYVKPRIHEPHITLMHPRNSTCNDLIFEEIKKIRLPARTTFQTISLIGQIDEGKWEILREFPIYSK
jgi:2'-5' RNA ligase superfamily protein